MGMALISNQVEGIEEFVLVFVGRNLEPIQVMNLCPNPVVVGPRLAVAPAVAPVLEQQK